MVSSLALAHGCWDRDRERAGEILLPVHFLLWGFPAHTNVNCVFLFCNQDLLAEQESE